MTPKQPIVNNNEESYFSGHAAGMKTAYEDFRETLRICNELCEAVLMDWPNKVDIAKNAAIHLKNINEDYDNERKK